MSLTPLALWTPGLPELIVILFIILLLFGAKRLPETMRSIGKGVKEFKKGMNEEEGEEKKETPPHERTPSGPDSAA
ncbi:MAG: twin-arginine translocase TatA/TatE family subunit [Candidatus Aureabacteria bacterium]|nr:twin-arginine translocase TatA/TatE family subunit [Candidatus Auribacterota bacterium]